MENKRRIYFIRKRCRWIWWTIIWISIKFRRTMWCVEVEPVTVSKICAHIRFKHISPSLKHKQKILDIFVSFLPFFALSTFFFFHLKIFGFFFHLHFVVVPCNVCEFFFEWKIRDEQLSHCIDAKWFIELNGKMESIISFSKWQQERMIYTETNKYSENDHESFYFLIPNERNMNKLASGYMSDEWYCCPLFKIWFAYFYHI